jgi:hypothetical protein
MEGQQQQPPPPPSSAYASHLASLIERRAADVQNAVEAAIPDAPVPTDAQRTEFLRAMEHVVEHDIQRWDPMCAKNAMASAISMCDLHDRDVLYPSTGPSTIYGTAWWQSVLLWYKGCVPAINSQTMPLYRRTAVTKLYLQKLERVLCTIHTIWIDAHPDLQITRNGSGVFTILWK